MPSDAPLTALLPEKSLSGSPVRVSEEFQAK